jgi:universal stress protein E
LLLSKSPRTAARPIVVAALDPFHAHAKPASLDGSILDAAVDAAGSTSRVYAVHAHLMPQPLLVDGGLEPYWIPLTKEQIDAYEAKHRRALERSAGRADVPPSNVVYLRGDVVDLLPRATKRLRADLVVMGAVSRSGLKRLFIGNSAERLLDKLECDVLVVKPRRFATSVPRRAARLMPYPPYPAM